VRLLQECIHIAQEGAHDGSDPFPCMTRMPRLPGRTCRKCHSGTRTITPSLSWMKGKRRIGMLHSGTFSGVLGQKQLYKNRVAISYGQASPTRLFAQDRVTIRMELHWLAFSLPDVNPFNEPGSKVITRVSHTLVITLLPGLLTGFTSSLEVMQVAQ
jgi:hypothetical protein